MRDMSFYLRRTFEVIRPSFAICNGNRFLLHSIFYFRNLLLFISSYFFFSSSIVVWAASPGVAESWTGGLIISGMGLMTWWCPCGTFNFLKAAPPHLGAVFYLVSDLWNFYTKNEKLFLYFSCVYCSLVILSWWRLVWSEFQRYRYSMFWCWLPRWGCWVLQESSPVAVHWYSCGFAPIKVPC